MAADLRNLILANNNENKALAAALQESEDKLTSLRAELATVIAERDALKAGSAEEQKTIDSLTEVSAARKATIEAWLTRAVRV